MLGRTSKNYFRGRSNKKPGDLFLMVGLLSRVDCGDSFITKEKGLWAVRADFFFFNSTNIGVFWEVISLGSPIFSFTFNLIY